MNCPHCQVKSNVPLMSPWIYLVLNSLHCKPWKSSDWKPTTQGTLPLRGSHVHLLQSAGFPAVPAVQKRVAAEFHRDVECEPSNVSLVGISDFTHTKHQKPSILAY